MATDDKGLVVITLPEEYGIVRVLIQPIIDDDDDSQRPIKPRILVSNVEPSNWQFGEKLL